MLKKVKSENSYIYMYAYAHMGKRYGSTAALVSISVCVLEVQQTSDQNTGIPIWNVCLSPQEWNL